MIHVVNKRGLYGYSVLETFEAGIKLLGPEVKSLRGGLFTFSGSFVSIREGELWLRKLQISPYQEKNTPKTYNPTRDRKLLMKKYDIQKVLSKSERKNATLIISDIHERTNGYFGVTIALVTKMKKHDKRNKIKERDV